MLSGWGILSPLADRSWLPLRTCHSSDRLSARTHTMHRRYHCHCPWQRFLFFYFSWVEVIVLLMGQLGSYRPTCSFHKADSLPGRAELGWNSLQHTYTEEKKTLLSQEQSPVSTPKPAPEKWRYPLPGRGMDLMAQTCTMPLVPHWAALDSSKVLLEKWDTSLLPSHPHTINKASHGLGPLKV